MATLKHVVAFLFVNVFRVGPDDRTGQNSSRRRAGGTPESFSRHASDLQQLGHSEEAEAEFRRALNACRETKCTFRGMILNNLGCLYHAMARYREAESLLQQAIDASGEDGQNPGSLPIAVENLAKVYRAEARYAEAGQLYERALKLRRDDPATAAKEIPRLLIHMAALAQDRGDLPRAEELIREAVAGFRADGSSESPDGLVALVNLGAILASEGKFAEAEAAERSALGVYRTQPPGPDYATALNTLGNVMAISGRPKEAEPLLREAVSVWENLLGSDHPSVASGLMNLGTVLQARHRYDEAEALMNRASRIDARSFPANHPRIAMDLNKQAGLLMARKRYREAEEFLLRAAAILDQRLTNADPELGQTLANLGELYRLEKRLPESRENFARGMKILIAAWGPLDQRLLTWLDNYASVLRAAEEYTEAGKIELQATRIRVIDARRRAG